MASACRLDTIYANALFYVYVHGFIYEYGRDWVEDEDREVARVIRRRAM